MRDAARFVRPGLLLISAGKLRPPGLALMTPHAREQRPKGRPSSRHVVRDHVRNGRVHEHEQKNAKCGTHRFLLGLLGPRSRHGPHCRGRPIPERSAARYWRATDMDASRVVRAARVRNCTSERNPDRFAPARLCNAWDLPIEAGRWRYATAIGSSSAACATGSVNVNLAPGPWDVSSTSSPPIRSASSRPIASPSPNPP
jgi:hypothetical protein